MKQKHIDAAKDVVCVVIASLKALEGALSGVGKTISEQHKFILDIHNKALGRINETPDKLDEILSELNSEMEKLVQPNK